MSGFRNAWGKHRRGFKGGLTLADNVFVYSIIKQPAQAARNVRLGDSAVSYQMGTWVMAILSRKPYLLAIAVMIAAAAVSAVTSLLG
ncbi:hypothetical protein K2O51_15040 [Cupriavidus pinatubonensis]|nr:hypothetical protein [Cupriavidus pinatubonensis]QYY32116.1 hypothetical protein K2O51_15040 [Cupriavidus pinatubonensis]